MNYWPKHVGPWLAATVTLSAAEEGLYSRLCDWAYKQEQPLPLDTEEVLKISRAKDKTERDTTMSMVARFFVQTDDGYHHERIEKELANARGRTARAVASRAENAARQKAYRDRRTALYAQANELGLQFHGIHATNEQLVEMILKVGATPITRNALRDASHNALCHASHTAAESQTLETSNLPLQEVREIASRVTSRVMSSHAVTDAGALCKRARALGMASVNPGDARLLELLQRGADPEAIVMACSEAVARSKGWGWALARAKGQHEDHEREHAEMLKWAPGLAHKG